MRLFWVWGIALILISGCLQSLTGSTVVIEDVLDTIVVEEKPVEEPEPAVEEEPVEEEVEEGVVEEEVVEEEVVEEEETEEEEQVNVIEIIDRKFVPEELTVKAGTTVIWKHLDETAKNEKKPHLIRIYPGGALSDRLEYGDEFEHTFTEPNTYRYIDIIYKESMRRGIVVVE